MPIDPDPINAWLYTVSLLIVILTAAVGALAWALRRRAAHLVQQQKAQQAELREFILEVTKPLQPGYKNGGDSMADQSAMLKTLLWNQEQIRSDFTRHIAYHLESKIEGNGQ